MVRTGRPRAKGPSASGLTTEQDILHAAGKLFGELGYGGTSTHAIAQAAGISQAAMYHYFPGKHTILLELLLRTVKPSIEYALSLAERDEPADVRLWALCSYDVTLLARGENNTGALYLLPDLSDEKFAAFHAERERLFGVYRELVDVVAGRAGQAGLVFGLVESVILRRRTEPGLHPEQVAPAVADAVLRVLQVGETRLAQVRDEAAVLEKVAD
ncbi:TetR/AcrR family transcriptional regulator [Kineosporia babensis]|uniref:TetR/AcrR family transcriptional regulator n=1 Tax=Kineosporia babensis TaxID=499548 RepID=A0A9X1NK12_9ACTN|nr:TetR/AcrR family transcriptional regulator [Kineosporia babensis]MCD5315004.1 TetR/AcrR family transcriptional regulator [Kineosporia babensis]